MSFGNNISIYALDVVIQRLSQSYINANVMISIQLIASRWFTLLFSDIYAIELKSQYPNSYVELCLRLLLAGNRTQSADISGSTHL